METTNTKQVLISEYSSRYAKDIGEFIVGIQHDEFGVDITLDQQPDLKNIESIYRSKNGNFWVAINNGNLVGTIALLDAGNGIGALRKMFVHRDFRGKEIGVGQKLLDTLLNWAKQKEFKEILLGTIDRFKAAQRFYVKNGFEEVNISNLPAEFPRMQVDTKFYKYRL